MFISLLYIHYIFNGVAKNTGYLVKLPIKWVLSNHITTVRIKFMPLSIIVDK